MADLSQFTTFHLHKDEARAFPDAADQIKCVAATLAGVLRVLAHFADEAEV